MAIYSYKAPDGKTVRFRGPEGLTQADIDLYGNNMFQPEPAPVIAPPPAAPKGESGFIPSIKRSGYQTGALLGDVLPAMVGKAFGAEDYAKRQMGEAAATLKKAEELYPAEVASYKDIKGVGDALTYIKEAIGEMVPSLIPSLVTGGAASVLARPAVAAATTAATEFATAEVARAAARNVLTRETLDGIRDAALKEGMKAAQKIALGSQAAGALAGSAVQNIPEVFQNIYQETGKMEIGPALVAGGFNAVLDAITPISLLRKIDTVGIPKEQIIAAWYKRAGKGAVTGFLTEGGTEAVQEASSAAAEKFVDQNKNFFTEKNFERFINAGLKGGFGGAAITSATDVLTGKGPEKTAGAPVAPPAAPKTSTVAATPTAPGADAQRIEELTQQAIQIGLPEEDARARAESIVATETATRAKQTEAKIAPRVATLTQEFIDAGVEPTQAQARAVQQAQQEVQADEDAAREQAGIGSVTQPIPRAVGEGMGVAGQPAASTAAPGVGVLEPTTMVPAGQAPAADVGREGAQPSAVEAFDPISFAERSAESALADAGGFESLKESIGAHRDNVVDTLRENGIDEPGDIQRAYDAYDAAIAAKTQPTEPTDGTQTTEAERKQAIEDLGDFDPLTDPNKPPYEGAQRRNGLWLSPDGKFSTVPAGGYGFTVLPNDVADFIMQNGFGTSHMNAVAGKAALAASRGQPYTEYLAALEKELADLDPDIAGSERDRFSKALEQTYGTQTPEAQQAEAQGPEAPAAGAPAVVEAPVVRKRKPRVVAEGKKLGRPVSLTDEQKAENKAKKDAIQAHKARAERATASAKAVLDALTKVDTIEVDALGVDGRSALRAKKREAIATLLDLQADPYLRGTAVAKRVKEALQHPSITPQELADLKKGLEAKKAGETLSKSTAPGSAADARFNKFTNGAQALSHIIKTGNAFQKLLGKRLRAFVTNVKFVVIEQGDALPAQLQTPENLKEWERARAVYLENEITREKVIYARGASFGADEQGVNNVTILHELLHAATNRKIGLALDAIRRGVRPNDPLVRAVRDLIRTMESAGATYNELVRTGKLPVGIRLIADERRGAALADPREFVAYGMTDENFQKFLMQARGFEEDTSFFNRFVRAIREMFGMGEDTTNALSDLILVTDTILRSRAPSKGVFSAGPSRSTILPTEEEGEENPAVRTQKEVDRAVAIASEKFSESKKGEEYAKAVSVAQMAQNPKKVAEALRGVWANFSPSARAALTRIAPTDFLSDLVSKAVPELKNTDMLLQKMHGMTLNLLKSAGTLTEEVDRAYRKDPSLADKLNEITFTSTLAEVDPSDPNAKERSAKLDGMWKNLGDDGRRLYKRIKEHFEVLSDYFTQLLDEQVSKSDLPAAERANLMQKMRAFYEQGSKILPYFPLIRRGDFWLSIGSGKTRKFFMYESAAERDRAAQAFADERIKQKPGESDAAFEQRRKDNLGELLDTEEYGVGNDVSSLRKATGNDSDLLRAVFEAIDSMKLSDDKAKEALKDTVYQIYLQTMPELSLRRQFIHRKGVAGFRTDILQATADASTRMATQLARLKYGRPIRNSVSQARDSIANRPEFSEVVSAFERRANEAINPGPQTVGEKVAAGLNKASFIWYLGGASSALLQPLSIFQTGFPVLAGKHGFGKASAELMKMMKVWNQYGTYKRNADGTRSFVMPTVEHAEGLNADERRAVQAMTDYGLTSSTYAGDVFDYKNTPSGNHSKPIVEFGKNAVDTLVLGGLMHTTERISREVVYLASYRLNRSAGLSHQGAVDQAVVDTKEALGNYGEYNRPEFMRGAVGKVLTQFMMYPVHVTLFLGRNFVEMMKPFGGRTKQEARRKFFGTLGTSFVLAGAVGLPMFSTVMGLLGWMWSQTQDDDEPDELRDMSFELWFRTKWMQEQLGDTKIAGASLANILERGVANAVTGLDISGRTSLNNLWFRDTKETASVRESAAALALEKAGPAANMVLSWFEAYEAFISGDYTKGLKKATPAGFRNFVNAHEQYTEGAKDNKGAEILSRDAFTTGELIGQAVGFRSDLLANTQYVTFKVIGLEQKINNERTAILNKLDREYRNNNMAAFDKYYEDMLEFNRKYPSYQITAENLLQSIESKEKRRAASYRGVDITEKNVDLLMPALTPSREAATAREGRGE